MLLGATIDIYGFIFLGVCGGEDRLPVLLLLFQ
jgi:hypothetical protein